jgi:NAD(P)-dependent dehydrogenase (short-subunit alcohol dehydrogenase family)
MRDGARRHAMRGSAVEAAMRDHYERALIVGVGDGLGASLARLFAREGMRVGLAARSVEKLAGLAAETGAVTHRCDATAAAEVEALFAAMDGALGGPPEVVVFNASHRVRGPFVTLDPAAVARTLAVAAFGGFLVAQAAAKRMVNAGRGAILFTGASASVKGYPQSAPFAMGKFALRGLAQSLARELQPRGIHVAHVVIDGGIRSARRVEPAEAPDSLLDPDAIAQSYLDLLRQDRSAWAWEIALRPWVERF